MEIDPAFSPGAETRSPAIICPYCGHESSSQTKCDACKGMTDPLSRQASQNAMGPWFIRDESAPFRPGCSYNTLRTLVARGRVSSRSVIRGPSTRQFWSRATHVPGVAHLLGECHACHIKVQPEATACPSCGASFDCSIDRQVMGLAPVRLLPGHAATEAIGQAMVEAVQSKRAGSRHEGGEKREPDAGSGHPGL